MTVVKFPTPPEKVAASWQPVELQQFLAVSADAIAAGEASAWEIGFTERNDPQVYLLGPPPDYECILSISRLGRVYVIEDGNGRVLFEHDNPMLLAEQATAALRRRKASLVARIAVAWCALREAFEEKTEVIMAGPIELLTHAAPQLATLA
jgi:CRP-like cAMP-binding protein